MKRPPKIRRQIVRTKQADLERRRRVDEVLLNGGGTMSNHSIAETTGTSAPFVGLRRRVLTNRLTRQLESLRKPFAETDRVRVGNRLSNSTPISPNVEEMLAKTTSRAAPVQVNALPQTVNFQKSTSSGNRSTEIGSPSRADLPTGAPDRDASGRPYPWSGFGEQPVAGSTGALDVIGKAAECKGGTGNVDVIGSPTSERVFWTGLRYMTQAEADERAAEYEDKQRASERGDWDPYAYADD